jgi:hypothetical protein
VACFKAFSEHLPGETEENTKKTLAQDSKKAPPEHKPGILPTELTCSVGRKWSWPVPRHYPGISIER